jgi:hypothetical protein
VVAFNERFSKISTKTNLLETLKLNLSKKTNFPEKKPRKKLVSKYQKSNGKKSCLNSQKFVYMKCLPKQESTVEGFHTKGWTKFFIVNFVTFYGQNNILKVLK